MSSIGTVFGILLFVWIGYNYLLIFGAQIGWIAEEKGSFYHFFFC